MNLHLLISRFQLFSIFLLHIPPSPRFLLKQKGAQLQVRGVALWSHPGVKDGQSRPGPQAMGVHEQRARPSKYRYVDFH